MALPSPRPLVIVIMPPWPKGGSANLFEACVAAYAAAGRDVYALLVPDNPDNNTHEADRRFVLDQMSFPDAIGADFLRPPHRRRARFERRLHKWLGRRRNVIDFWASSIAARQLPPDLEALLRGRVVETIHVHHCWNMKLAARLARQSQRRTALRPRLVCETHDIQSANKDVIQGTLWLNRKSDPSSLIGSELRMCRLADLLLHINPQEERFFREHLPDRRHAVIEPTISPATEQALRQLRTQPASAKRELVYVATDNFWNIATASWLVEQVIPRAPRLRDHIRIQGQIRDGMRRVRPELLQGNEALFAGPVDRIADAYASAKGILVPALGGSGSSIKLLEGLCTGLPLLGTTGVVRGIDPGWVARMPIILHDDPGAFAEAALAIVDDGRAETGSAEMFERHFSNASYQARFRTILGLDPPTDRPMASATD